MPAERRSSDYAEVLQEVELDEPGSTEMLAEMVATGDRSASAITASATVPAPGTGTGTVPVMRAWSGNLPVIMPRSRHPEMLLKMPARSQPTASGECLLINGNYFVRSPAETGLLAYAVSVAAGPASRLIQWTASLTAERAQEDVNRALMRATSEFTRLRWFVQPGPFGTHVRCLGYL
jgi:hypothetical protein